MGIKDGKADDIVMVNGGSAGKALLELSWESYLMPWYCWDTSCLENWYGKWLIGLLFHL